jgi:6-phosphogluconolactonase/glucosamine-6-phosphate isomerase/deaminase
MAYTIQYHPLEKVSKMAGEYLTQILHDHSHSPILLLLSGGSSTKPLEHALVPKSCEHITLGLLDERYGVPASDLNIASIQSTHFYTQAFAHGARLLMTSPISNYTLERAGVEFDTALKSWKQENPTGVIIATQGMGSDGHTSGILPFTEDEVFFNSLFDNSEKWAIGYTAEGELHFPKRITTTLPFLRDMIDISVVHVIGEGKRPGLEPALIPHQPLFKTPAAVVQQMKNVTIFTDLLLSTAYDPQ